MFIRMFDFVMAFLYMYMVQSSVPVTSIKVTYNYLDCSADMRLIHR